MKLMILMVMILLDYFTGHASIFVVTSNTNGGAGSLRTAINNANNSMGKDTIEFNLGSSIAARSISLTSSLPIINEALVINGSSQPSARFGNSGAKIIIRAVTSNVVGFRLYADSCEVYGLYIKGCGNAILFKVSDININSIIGAPHKGNVLSGNIGNGISGFNLIKTTIQSNFIGLDTNGLNPENNFGYGISASSYLTNGIIGGYNNDEGNTIGNNDLGGVFLAGGDSLQFIGNKIGVTFDGNSIAGNGGIGASVGFVGDNEGYIIENNVISNNEEGGIRVSSDQSVIRNNLIGTDISGTLNYGNQGEYGLTVDGKRVEIRNNVISGNLGKGIIINQFARQISVTANKIGCDISGLNAIGNSDYGIEINGDSCIIGGFDEEERNIISGNLSGVYLSADEVKILNNYIGVAVDGQTALGNYSFGVIISGALDFKIGQITEGGNLIAGNLNRGIQFFSGQGEIAGNIIGVGADSISLGTTQNKGIELWAGASGTIRNNLISSHLTDGIYLQSSSNVSITGNLITQNGEQGIELNGTCFTIEIGADSIPNDITENGFEGIYISATSNFVSFYSNTFTCNGEIGGSAGVFGENGFNNGLLPGTVAFNDGLLTGESIPFSRIDIYSSNENCIQCEGQNTINTVYANDLGSWQTEIIQGASRIIIMTTDTSDSRSSAFSDCIQNIVSTSNELLPMEVFPNPFTHELIINSNDVLNIKIIGVEGKIYHQQKITPFNNSIDLSYLHNGLYFIDFDRLELKKIKILKIN